MRGKKREDEERGRGKRGNEGKIKITAYLVDNFRPVHFLDGLLAELRKVLGEPLQHFLVVLKSSLLVPVPQVERKHVRVLEDLAALDELLVGGLEELDVRPYRVGVLLLEEDHARLRLLHGLPREVLGLGVRLEALVVVEVAVQLPLRLGGIGLVVAVHVGIELVALVVSLREGGSASIIGTRWT